MSENNVMIYKNIEVPYTLIKSRRRSCSISIDIQKGVIVRIPLGYSQRKLEELLREKEDWIVSHYRKYRMAQEKAAKNCGSMTPVQREALKKRYRDAAKEYIPKRVQYYSQFIKCDYKKIAVRDQKTRWGSCSESGTLSFSWRLMLAPSTVLDYVVVHELCHFEHMNHSREFWQAVEKVMPDYKEKRKWLKDHGTELMMF